MRVLMKSTTEAVVKTNSDRPLDFHRRLPGYEESPIVEAPELAKKLGVAKVYVKSETARYGLPSFKVLGASWATYAALRDQLGPLPEGQLTAEQLHDWAEPVRSLTLIAATDGNHGRAVARVAKWFGLKARIFLPGFVSDARIEAIEAEGAEVRIVEGDYDASVDASIEDAKNPDTLLISDTARAATDVVPQLVAAGYTTAFVEIEDQLARTGDDAIDVVAVQAGVGGLASAGTNWARHTRKDRSPKVMVVEPEAAPCVFAALAAGEPVPVSAKGDSEMAVLQCGTVSLTAFDILQSGVSCALAIEDEWALKAVAELAKCGISTGPSGAAGAAGLIAALSGPMAEQIKQHMGITSESRLLVVASESSAAGESVSEIDRIAA